MPQPPHARALPTGDATAALAALAWLVEAGVDTLVENTPVCWLDAARRAEVATTDVILPADVPPAARRSPAVSTANLPSTDAAAHLARAANAETLDALAALRVDGADRRLLLADGNPAARVMVLGDMPSADDIASGQLFAGASGQLLDTMLAAIGRDRANTYLANLLTTPTPGGRTPQAHEIAAALPYLHRQIELVQPHALLVLGGVAAAALLNVHSGINRLRGRWQTLEIGALQVSVLPSFAPAYLCAHPAHKALAWRDLLLFKAALAVHTDAP